MFRKTPFLMLLSVMLSAEIFAQVRDIPAEKFSSAQFDEQISLYLKKSKKQETYAWILLGSGLTAMSLALS